MTAPSRAAVRHDHLPFVAVLLVAVLVWRGRWPAATATAVALFLLLQARSLSGAFESWLRRGEASALRLVGHLLMTVTNAAAFALVILPIFVVTAPFHRRPFGVPSGSNGWVARGDSPLAATPQQSYRPDPQRSSIPVRRLVARAAMVVAMLLVIDVVAGAVLAGTRIMPGDQVAFVEAQRWLEDSMDSPVIREEPWADQYTRDGLRLFAQRQEYVPFLVYGFLPFQSRYINTTNRERVSYEPALAAGQRPLRVAFFGGSVMWGVGQRDDHTIPSAFARAAEAAGVPVEVHNYGMYGWVAWQEYEYLERLLAAGEQYDLVVFYDGLNDYGVQFSDFSVDPTHGGSKILQHYGAEIHDNLYTYPGYLDGARDLFDAYRRNSGLARVVDHFTTPPGQLPVWMQSEVPSEPTAVRAALDVYGRSQRAISDLADDYDTPVRFFFQAIASGWSPDLLTRLPPDTIDASDVLDGAEDEVYIDGGHTSERGAQIIAERLWQEVRPVLDAPDGRAD